MQKAPSHDHVLYKMRKSRDCGEEELCNRCKSAIGVWYDYKGLPASAIARGTGS